MRDTRSNLLTQRLDTPRPDEIGITTDSPELLYRVRAAPGLSSGQPEGAPFEARSIISIKDGVQIRSVWI